MIYFEYDDDPHLYIHTNNILIMNNNINDNNNN